jgi:hypothetical protein
MATNEPAADQLAEALKFILHEAEHPQLGPAWTSRKRIAERARAALAAYSAEREGGPNGESNE